MFNTVHVVSYISCYILKIFEGSKHCFYRCRICIQRGQWHDYYLILEICFILNHPRLLYITFPYSSENYQYSNHNILMRNVPSPCILFPCEGKPISVTFLSSTLPTPFPSVDGLWKDPRAALTQSFSGECVVLRLEAL